MVEAVLMTGGNRADSRERLAAALQLLERQAGRVVRTSKVYTTASWGFESADFSNQAVVIATELAPEQLLDAVQDIERQLGRDREAEAAEKRSSGQPYASRPADIDIIFYGRETVESARLTIPHPRAGERMFVLEPLNEIVPQAVHPVTGLTVGEMYRRLKAKEESDK